jgi:hypothetical protein
VFARRACAVRLVRDHPKDHASQRAAIQPITAQQRARLKALAKAHREWRRASDLACRALARGTATLVRYSLRRAFSIPRWSDLAPSHEQL